MQISMAWRLIARVFLPFAAGYYLSYLFRTINALIAGHLISDTGLDTADLGLLTAVYFLVFAAAQIPVGILLDRLVRVASSVSLVAAQVPDHSRCPRGCRSPDFASNDRPWGGCGVDGCLKSIVLWFPRERVPCSTAT